MLKWLAVLAIFAMFTLSAYAFDHTHPGARIGPIPHFGNGGGWHGGGFQNGHQWGGSVMRPFDSGLYPQNRGGPCWAWSDRMGGWVRVC